MQSTILSSLIELDQRGELSGAYTDIPNEIYHHPESPGKSSSQLKIIGGQSYSHLSAEKKSSSSSMDFGTLFHSYVLEPDLFKKTYSRNPLDPSKVFVPSRDFERLEHMSKKLMEHPDAQQFLIDAEREVTYYSRDFDTKILKKARLDLRKGLAIADLKTCRDASASAFKRAARMYNYRFSGAYYLEVASEVLRERLSDFYLIACENEYPFEVAVYRIDDRSIIDAQAEIREALEKTRLAESGGWAGYELGIKDLWL